MFNTPKTLIVVYKDELLINQLKKLVESHDDTEEGIVGTRDDSINIVSWTEKVWLGNKKAGNISGKILFLGDIKGTDKLIPVLDEKFSDCGVKYGWAGNQAVLYVETKELTDRVKYDIFLKKLSELPVPEFLKTLKESVASTIENESIEEQETISDNVSIPEIDNNFKEEHNKLDITKVAQRAIETGKCTAKKAFKAGSDIAQRVGTQVSVKSEELFRNKSLMERQMLFYGVIHLYNEGLEDFMNM